MEINKKKLLTPIIEIGGSMLSVSRFIHDVTEGKQVDKKVRAHRQLLETVTNNMPNAVALMRGNDLRIVFVNPAYKAITSEKEILGKTLDELWPELNCDFTSLCRGVLETGKPFYKKDSLFMIRRSLDAVLEATYFTWWLIPVNLPGGEGRGILNMAQETTERKNTEQALEEAYEKIKNLNEQLEVENVYLREKIKSSDVKLGIIGTSNAIRCVNDKIKQVAQTNATVLLTGETGTGKGVFARALHEMSNRKGKPFVHVNCAGLPPNLIESELFGREKGAFTGSTARPIGRFELAQGGTIFLDEIGELPSELQAKLLKVIEDGELERLGSPHPIKLDVRIIASTNRNLDEEIKKGLFRMDLFYRLNVFPITIPPLRERREDILLLAKSFTEKFSKRHGKNIKKISQNTIKALESYDWPGNVRELMHVIERAVILSDRPMLPPVEKVDALQDGPPQMKISKDINAPEIKCMADVEREHILATLQRTKWKIAGPQGAAQILRMKPSTMRFRMKKLGLKRPTAH